MRLIPWLLTLTGAIWTTGNAMIIVVAMAAFTWQRDHPLALSRDGLGGALGAAMGLWSTAVGLLLLVAMVSLGWLAGTAWRTAQRGRAALLVLAMAGLWGVHSVNHRTVVETNQVTAGIRELRGAAVTQQAEQKTDQQMDQKTEVAPTSQPLHALEQRFAVLHRMSERWHTIETVLALVLLISASTVLLRRPRESTAPPSTTATPSASSPSA